MKVRSPLANIEVGVDRISRQGNNLVLHSGNGSSIDAQISVSAGEVLRTLGRVLTSLPGLTFVIGLPFFWLRERLGGAGSAAMAGANRADNINKPW